MAEKVKILLLENIHDIAVESFLDEGFEVERKSGALSEGELVKLLPGHQVLGIRSKTKLSSSIFERAPDLLAVGAFCIGTDQVETTAANRLGVPVFNAPYSNTRSVAELVISEMIALSRRLGDRNMLAHKGVWDKSADGSHEVRGKILGIIGYGHIGSQVSVLAESLGLRVIFYDIVKKLPLGNSRQVEKLEDLLAVSDFISLHVPETPQTKRMIGKIQLDQMKKGSFLLNASRGSVVILPDLVDALKTGHVAGVAVDVFPEEPSSNKDPFKCELQGLSNVILTPHVGGSTVEAQAAIGREVADSLIRFLRFGTTVGAVNFPHVDLPFEKDVHRVVNVHKNVPGVLRDINKIVSDLGANIRGQSLWTDPQIGYLVIDIEKTDAREAAERIGKLPTSVKTRLLF